MSMLMASSPHQHQKRDTATIMRLVMLCAVPGIAAQTFIFGWGTIIHLVLACVVAVVTEASIVELRKRNIEIAIKDSSALLTALLLAISIPAFAPWWVTVIGTFFAIAIVKQLYGGLGFNLFNPAMAAYIALLISFPVQMTAWAPPISIAEQTLSFADSWSIIFSQYSVEGFSVSQMRASIDGFTTATPLDHIKTAVSHHITVEEAFDDTLFSNGWSIGWTAISASYLFGGLMLVYLRVISWHIPMSLLLSIAAMASLFYLFDSDQYASPLFHIMNGSAILGAFFIATDPVTAATSNKGRIIFGVAIGFWIYVIRTWGGYPDAIAFAVVLMNMAVPVIDYYTKPKPYGHNKVANKPKPASKTGAKPNSESNATNDGDVQKEGPSL